MRRYLYGELEKGKAHTGQEEFLSDTISLRCRTEILQANKYSSWKKILRIRAWVHRFARNCRGIEKKGGEISADEIYDSRIEIIREVQKEAFETEYNRLLNGRPLNATSKILALC